MEYADGRRRKVVFVSHCLLNQNSRGPGIAFRAGPSTELIQIFLKNDISMIQLPCCECIGWGGTARNKFESYLPLVINAAKFGWFPLLVPLLKVSLSSYNRLCKKEARKVLARMEDYIQNGYAICGVVGMNDSPTCGVTKTMDMVEFLRRMAIATHEHKFADVKEIDRDTLIDGESFFMGNIIKEMKRRRLDVRVIGYEPWAESLKVESERIAKCLDLRI